MDLEKLTNQPEKLIKLAKNGDEAAFGMLYELYFTPIYRYVYLRVKSRALAQDLTQEVFMKAFEAVSGFEERGRPPLAYFFTIARNTIANFWRKKKEINVGQPEETFKNLRAENGNPETLADGKIAAKNIKSALECLTDEQQEIIILKFVNELSNKEIAGLTGKSEAAIRQLQFRGLKQIRKFFKENGLLNNNI